MLCDTKLVRLNGGTIQEEKKGWYDLDVILMHSIIIVYGPILTIHLIDVARKVLPEM